MKHLQRDLEHLKKEILILGSMVEQALVKAERVLSHRDSALAHEVVEGDREIDRREVEVEESCLKMLALHQPVAADLRFIIAVLKVNNDLERMGDLAKNMAKRAASLAEGPELECVPDLLKMAEQVREMLSKCLDALVGTDPDLARKVLMMDDGIDQANRDMFTRVQSVIRRNPDEVERGILALSISRNLERIADQATNVAEDVIFMVEGELVRHPSRF